MTLILMALSERGTLKQDNGYGSSQVTITFTMLLWRMRMAKFMDSNVTEQEQLLD